MNYLFLDIDGVLNSTRSYLALNGFPRPTQPETLKTHNDPVAVGLIRRLCKIAEAKVILSSSWRHSMPLATIGELLELPIIDQTPTLATTDTSDSLRSREILEYLDAHSEVVDFAIVDDMPMGNKLRSRAVRTSEYEGLTYDDYVQLCRLFNVNRFQKLPETSNVSA